MALTSVGAMRWNVRSSGQTGTDACTLETTLMAHFERLRSQFIALPDSTRVSDPVGVLIMVGSFVGSFVDSLLFGLAKIVQDQQHRCHAHRGGRDPNG
jgi:hypothetical protein